MSPKEYFGAKCAPIWLISAWGDLGVCLGLRARRTCGDQHCCGGLSAGDLHVISAASSPGAMSLCREVLLSEQSDALLFAQHALTAILSGATQPVPPPFCGQTFPVRQRQGDKNTFRVLIPFCFWRRVRATPRID